MPADPFKVFLYYLHYKYGRPFTSRKSLERWQSKKIKKHLKYVAKYSPLYHGMKQLDQYPVADKPFMMKNFSKLNTVGICREEAEAFAIKAEKNRDFAPKLKGVTVGLSSGTSGNRGIFLVSDHEKNQWAGYILANFLPNNLFTSCSIAFFMRADSNLYEAVRSRQIRFHFFDLYQDLGTHRHRLEEICPQILVGQPSLLLMLAGEKATGRLAIFPQIVISIAEVLEKEDEARLKKAFGLKVIHQVYQCTEGCLATTCPYGTLHLNEDIVSIEREYLDGHRFIPIVTDFCRKAQPVIRYRLNDILIERKKPCPCKSPFLALEKIEGREDDIFQFQSPDGTIKQVFPDFIRRCFLFACAQETHLGDYRAVQDTDGKIIIHAHLTESGKKQVQKEFQYLAQDQGFLLPEITFQPYTWEPGKKMKRVERKLPLKLPEGGSTNEVQSKSTIPQS